MGLPLRSVLLDPALLPEAELLVVDQSDQSQDDGCRRDEGVAEPEVDEPQGGAADVDAGMSDQHVDPDDHPVAGRREHDVHRHQGHVAAEEGGGDVDADDQSDDERRGVVGDDPPADEAGRGEPQDGVVDAVEVQVREDVLQRPAPTRDHAVEQIRYLANDEADCSLSQMAGESQPYDGNGGKSATDREDVGETETSVELTKGRQCCRAGHQDSFEDERMRTVEIYYNNFYIKCQSYTRIYTVMLYN